MTPQELKAGILQLAFSGKLTAQLSSDVDVNKLIAKCEKDKQNTIREGKCRSEKFRGAIANHGYEIPSSWRVLYISDVALFQEGPGILAADFRASGVPLIRISGMRTQRVSLEGCNYLDPVMVENKWKHFRLDVGDVLISTSASMDKVCEVFEDCAGAIPYTGQIRFKMYGGISKEFFKWFVQSPLYISQISNYQVGSAIKHYGPTHLKRMTIPLPPLAEQKRIVAKIEELLPLIDRYEKAWSKLEDFNKRFPGDMQKSLLQMAIQGKLVEQRPEEGTGEELLEKILATKNTKGTKKNSRAEARRRGERASVLPREEIPDDEKPFDIPESWVWVRLGEVGSWGSGATPSRTHAEYFGGSIPWLKTGDLNDGYVSSIPETITDLALEETSVRLNPVGSVLMAMYGATIGKLGILQIAATTNQACCACIPYDGVWNKYLFYYLMARRKAFIKMGEGGAQPNISKEKIVNALIPLPPLAEQKRIVAKLEELLPLCERLK